jgi:hypothetical protein
MHPVLKMPGLRLIISGQISPLDVTRIRAALKKSISEGKPVAVEVWLDSMGGDVFSALEIGRVVRAAKANTEVRGKCASACVLILVAGVSRMAAPGSVGIHRPTFTNLDKDVPYKEVRSRLEKMEQAVAVYLKEMDIPNSLLEAMKATPPDQIEWLSRKELQSYRITGVDPASEELHAAAMADHFKISKQEYLRRLASVDKICVSEDFVLSMKCYMRVLETGQ